MKKNRKKLTKGEKKKIVDKVMQEKVKPKVKEQEQKREKCQYRE